MRFGERPPSNKDSVGKKLLKVGAAVTSGLAIYNGVAGEPIQDTIKRGLGWERRTFQMDTRDVTMFKESRWNEIKKKNSCMTQHCRFFRLNLGTWKDIE